MYFIQVITSIVQRYSYEIRTQIIWSICYFPESLGSGFFIIYIKGGIC